MRVHRFVPLAARASDAASSRPRWLTGRGWRRPVAAAGSLVLLGAGAVAFAGPAQANTAATVYVSTGGSNSADCLTLATACATVSEGVAAAQSLLAGYSSIDVTVSIAAGTYTDNVNVGDVPSGDSLTLAGHAASDTSIDGGGNGSVIAIDSGVVTVSDLTLTGGNASSGGGITNFGTLTVSGSTLSGNTAADGGGIYNHEGTVTVSGSTLSGNTATEGGGGITNDDGTVTVSGSTLSGNTATSGGGIFNYLDTVTVSGSTLSGNTATDGGGIYNHFGHAVTVSASILSGSPCDGDAVADGGYNVSDDHSCVSAATSLANSASIGLGVLAANGSTGPQTQAITASSSAHQLVPTASGFCTATDERGLPRPGVTGASKCDAGAFELQQTTPACTSTITSPRRAPLTVSAGKTCVIGTTIKGAITVRPGASLDLEHAKITGGIAANGPATIRICGTTITGGITITGATGPVVIGDPANGCTANIIKGGLTATGNTGGGTISGNKITGSFTITGNTPAFTVTGNHH